MTKRTVLNAIWLILIVSLQACDADLRIVTTGTGQKLACDPNVTNCDFLAADTPKCILSEPGLIPENIKSGVIISGIEGVLEPRPADCSANGSQNCVATGSYKAARDCGADGSNCYLPNYAASTQPLKAINYDNIDASRILTTFSISGKTGTYVPDFPDVSNVLNTDTTNSIPGTLTLPAPANVLTGSGTYGIAGTSETPGYSPDFPDLSNVLAVDTVDGNPGTYIPDFPDVGNVLNTDTTNTIPGTLTLPAPNTVRNTTSYGVSGTGQTGTLADCSANGSQGCVTTASFVAAQPKGNWNLSSAFPGSGYYTGISNPPVAGDLKRGIQVNGVTGEYPSDSSPLERYSDSGATTNVSGSPIPDLTSFVTGLTNDGVFEYWDSAGVRYTGSGDSDIISANITSGINFENLSIIGSAPPATPPDAFDVRAGTVINGVTGLMKVNCRNAANSSIYNYDGNTDSIPQIGTTAGSTIDWWDTIDNWSNNVNYLPTAQPSGWTSDNLCGKEIWSDITSDGTCDSPADDCMMKDNVSGLIWSEASPVTGAAATSTLVTWDTAVDHCNDLVYGGRNDWRLPTQMELMEAYTHGIRQLGYKGGSLIDSLDNNANFIPNVDERYWSSTSVSFRTTDAWDVYLHMGVASYYNKFNTFHFVCVAP